MTLLELMSNSSIVGLGGVLGGSLLGYLGARSSKPHEVQVAANGALHEAIEGFKAQLTMANVMLETANRDRHDMREEIDELRRLIGVQTDKIDGQSTKIAEQAETIERLNTHISDLNTHIDTLRSLLSGRCSASECPVYVGRVPMLRDNDDEPSLF